MNTRLQVEHPVTEMITGEDLVEWQIRVAMGEPLPKQQAQLKANGHAFEARIYAEDPAKDFLPATGRLIHLNPPAESSHVRIDSGVCQGDEIGIHYDPMIAKLIVWDEDRAKALGRLKTALGEFEVAGLVTNIDFLQQIAANPAFAKSAVDTGWLDREREALTQQRTDVSGQVLALAALDILLKREESVRGEALTSCDPYSPWHAASGWRMNDDNHHDLIFKDGAREFPVTVHYRKEGWQIDLADGTKLSARAVRMPDGGLQADLDGTRLCARVVHDGLMLSVFESGRTWRLERFDPLALAAKRDSQGGSLAAPMPGKITQVLVKPGDAVTLGQPLMILEAMKMEHTIKAPGDGVVETVHFQPGDQASDGDVLIAFKQVEA